MPSWNFCPSEEVRLVNVAHDERINAATIIITELFFIFFSPI